MANPEHVEIVKRGAEAIVKWRDENPGARLYLRRANLPGANLRGANLRRANLGFANLGGADLRGADLRGANFTGARLLTALLSRADLRGALLNQVNLILADLRGADLREARLVEARLRGARLDAAELAGSILWGTRLSDVDISRVKGLLEVKHYGPSTVGIDTFIKSKGQIPREFLIGCGVPEAMIDQMMYGLSAMEPIQFYSCFISYSHNDEEFCQRLYSRLRDKGLRVWYAPEDMKSGEKIHEQIDQAIRVHDKLLLVLSDESMSSEWVKTEIAHARERELTENRRVLHPIRLVTFAAIRSWKCFDADTGKDSAREIREYFIPDFSNWKDHDAFEAAFDRLMSDLRDEGESQS